MGRFAAPAAQRVLTPALAAVCLGYFMIILDTTIVNVAVPAIGEDLGADLSELQWVVDSYLVLLAAGILTGGALSDRFTARRIFVIGISLFTITSFACGLAPNTETLIVARALKGVAAALLVPSSLALVRAGYSDPALRRRAVAMWATIAGFGAAAGPVLGGLGVAAWSWRIVFLVNVPVGLLVLFLTSRHVPCGVGVPRSLDLTGQVLAVLTLGSLAIALIEGAHAGYNAPTAIAVFLFLAGATGFLAVERRVPEPMLPLHLFRNSTIAGGAVIGLLINFGFYGALFVLNIYLQAERDASAIEAGLVLLPQLAVIIPGSMVSARWSARPGGPVGTACLGMFLTGAGIAGCMVTGPNVSYAALVLPLSAAGFGMGMVMPAVTAALTDAAPAHHAGLAAGVINAARQSGSVVGIALLGGILGAGDAVTTHLRYGLGIAAAAFFVGVIVAARCIPRPHADEAHVPAQAEAPSRPRTTPVNVRL
jgi:DHA2 family methylenomycin A resistance protein-like MFS transporter